MAIIQKAKTATPPAVLAGRYREVKANPHALPSLPLFSKGLISAA